MNRDFSQLIGQIAAAGRYLAKLGFHGALAGNLSVRVSSDQILCTRHGADKGALGTEDFVMCDSEGKKIEGSGEPTSEINMHSIVYRTRPDMNAVVHAHPLTATAFAAVSQAPETINLPEMIVLLGPASLVPYATPGSELLACNLAKHLPNSEAFILENHGCLTIGESIAQAAYRMELLEQIAKISLTIKQLGKPFQLSAEESKALLSLREKNKGWGDEMITEL